MTQGERVKDFKAFKEAHEKATKKVKEIAREAQDLVTGLYIAIKNKEEKVYGKYVLNIDVCYEQILCVERHLANMPRVLGYAINDSAEEDYSYVFNRMNDLEEMAESNFETIEHLISKYYPTLRRSSHG